MEMERFWHTGTSLPFDGRANLRRSAMATDIDPYITRQQMGATMSTTPQPEQAPELTRVERFLKRPDVAWDGMWIDLARQL